MDYAVQLQEAAQEIAERDAQLLTCKQGGEQLGHQIQQTEAQLAQLKADLDRTQQQIQELERELKTLRRVENISQALHSIHSAQSEHSLMWLVQELKEVIHTIPRDLEDPKLADLRSAAANDLADACISYAKEQREKDDGNLNSAIVCLRDALANSEEYKVDAMRELQASLLEQREDGIADLAQAAEIYRAQDRQRQLAAVYARMAFIHEGNGQTQQALLAHYNRLAPLESEIKSDDFMQCLISINLLGAQLQTPLDQEQHAYEWGIQYFEREGEVDCIARVGQLAAGRGFEEIASQAQERATQVDDTIPEEEIPATAGREDKINAQITYVKGQLDEYRDTLRVLEKKIAQAGGESEAEVKTLKARERAQEEIKKLEDELSDLEQSQSEPGETE